MKKAISAATSAALLASLLATAVAPSAAAASVSVVTGLTPAPINGTTPLALGVALVSFSPATAIGAGTTVSVVLPGAATVNTTAADWSISEGGASAAPTSVTWTVGTHTATFLVATGSVATLPYTFSIIAAGTGPWVTNGTTSGSFNVTVNTQVGDSGIALASESVTAGPVASITISPNPTASVAGGGGTLQFSAVCKDSGSNIVQCGTVTWTATAGGGTGTITTGGLYTAGTVGTVTVTGTANSITSSATTVTNTTVAASVVCSPSSGTIAAGSHVTCLYSPGTGAPVDPTWTATNFTPTGPVAAAGDTFTAVNAGLTSLTGTIVTTGSVAATFTYTISPTPVTLPGVPAVPGTVTLSATKTIVRGGPKVDPVYTFTEGTAGDWAAGQWVTACFVDGNGAAVAISGGTLAGPDALAFGSSSYSVSGNCFTVTLGGSDNSRLEAFTVSDLNFQAASTNKPGAITANYTTNLGGYSAYFGGTSATASGTLAAATSISTGTTLLINLGVSSVPFQATTGGNGNYLVNAPTTNANYESLASTGNPSAVGCGGACLSGQQEVFATTASNHAVGEPITQTIFGSIGTLPSPGTISDALSLVANSAPQLLVGVSNQLPGTVTLAEQSGSTGLLALNTVITLKVQTAGVQFSALPTFVVTYPLGGSGLTLGSGTLSLDRTSATFTVTAADTSGLANVTFGMLYDVAPTATTGGAVNLAVTAGSIAMATSPVINAYIGSTVFITSTAPTVFINVNDQAMGNATITETAPATIGSAAGNNTVYACLTSGESWTRAPWLVRTAGDISITNPNLLTGGTQAVGTQVAGYPNCYEWAVYTASTVASTLQIEGVDASGNPTPTARISVPNGLQPGPVYLAVWVGGANSAVAGNLLNTVTVGVRAFQFGITVSSDGQPFIAPGTVTGPAGNLTIAQTGPNLLVAGEVITCKVLPRTNQPSIQDTLLASANQNLLPVVSTDGVTSGLQAHLASHTATTFTIMVDQGATVTPGGKIFIKNINYTTTADAVTGPVLVECTNVTSGAAFDQFVSNATIGNLSGLHIAANSALGLNPTSGYTMHTPKYQAVGKYVTWKFTGGTALAGQRVNVLVAKHINGAWGGPVYYKSAWADANGIVTFAWTSKTAAAINVRVQWPGSTAYAASTSKALGAYYK
jgi:hypothetical protein